MKPAPQHIAACKPGLPARRTPGAKAPATIASIAPDPRPDNSCPKLYLNRELSWLEFNKRVLHEADDDRNPLLERVKFLAIADSNIDDFYMKRIGGLKQQIGAGITRPSVDGLTPGQQISQCIGEIRAFQNRAANILASVMSQLAMAGIEVRKYRALNKIERDRLVQTFRKKILPLITPLPIDADLPFPFISNLSLNLLVEFRRPGAKKPVLARIKIPDSTIVPRFVKIGQGHDYVLIEDIIVNNLGLLFPRLKVRGSGLFRITRNAISDMDSAGANDLLEVIESQLRTRKFAPVVRLQTNAGISPDNRKKLAAKLGLDDARDVFENDTMLGVGDLLELTTIDMAALLHDPHRQIDHPALPASRDIFASIRQAGSILVQHPYESFTSSVERLVREASTDPHTLSIKMTLYRTSADTKIIEYLINAAQNGKQVAVVVELQARFDEAANMIWAARLEQAGIHVNYGVFGLKTHCKTILIVRREDGGLSRYAHFGTGNYHAGTARIYSDLGLLTCDEELVGDLTELFNHLTTRWNTGRNYSRLLVSPLAIKQALLAKIDREIARHGAKSPGLIRFKSNALEDVDIVNALYRASQAGVRVELLIRDICRLRPGVKNLSENITVTSIVGRFLEHARVYYFRNGGDGEYFIGSADLMKRNLERRIEIIVPVRDAAARGLLDELLESQLQDRRNAWEMDADGHYAQCRPAAGKADFGSHDMAIQAAVARRAAFAGNPPTGQPGLPPRTQHVSSPARYERGKRP